MDARLIDVCIIGGGISGLACAVFAKQLCPGAKIIVLERAALAENADDGKSVVFNEQSARWLADAGAWDENARPLRRVRACFSGFPGAFRFAADGDAPLGCGASHAKIRAALAAKLKKEIVAPAEVLHFDDTGGRAIIRYSGGGEKIKTKTKPKTIRARMTVFACEAPFLPSAFRAREYDYRQAAIAFSAKAENPPGDCAYEVFTERGVVALVPRAEESAPVGVVICAPSAEAGALCALSDKQLEEWLNEVFGGRFGLHICGKRAVYAPRLRHTVPLAAGRVVCIGAGATQLHPIGAQGLNLGIHDARAFAECWRDYFPRSDGGDGNDNDYGDKDGDDNNRCAKVINAYRNRRRAAHLTMITATSALAFAACASSAPPMRIAGGACAEILSRLGNSPSIKKPLTDILSGRTG